MQTKRTHVRAILICWIFLFCAAASAQRNPKDAFEYPPLHEIRVPEVTTAVLSNGIEVYLVEDHQYPTISLNLLVRTGDVFEPADKLGLAAITAATLRTGGTEKMTGDEIDEALETMAASISASVGSLNGNVRAHMLAEDFNAVLPILADILMRPVFDEAKVELARIEQKTAISRRNDDVGEIARREFRKLVYGRSDPYARHPEYATIDAVTRGDIVGFYRDFFHPANIMMAVWGDFRREEMLTALEGALGSWERGEAAVPEYPKVNYEHSCAVRYIERTDVNQSNILFGHIGGLRSSPDYPALAIMNRILSFDRMFKKIRSDEGLAYNVWGNYGAGYLVPSLFSAGAQTKSESTVRAIELMLAEMRRMMEEEVTDEELKRARDQYLNSYVFNYDSTSEIVNSMMLYAFFGYPLDFDVRFQRELARVTKADVLRVAKTYLRPQHVRILVAGNQADFDRPLSELGDVQAVDVSIPAPDSGRAKSEASEDSLALGRAALERAAIALGGSVKLRSLENRTVHIEIVDMTAGGMKFPATLTEQWPDKARLTLSTGGGQISIVVDGDQGWVKHPGGIAPLPSMQREEIGAGIAMNPIHVLGHPEKFEASCNGEKEVRGKALLELSVRGEGRSFELYLDPKTHLPAGIARQGNGPAGPARRLELFSDYREADGVQVHFRTEAYSDETLVSEILCLDCAFNTPLEKDFFRTK